jgi:hypothetical protein
MGLSQTSAGSKLQVVHKISTQFTVGIPTEGLLFDSVPRSTGVRAIAFDAVPFCIATCWRWRRSPRITVGTPFATPIRDEGADPIVLAAILVVLTKKQIVPLIQLQAL